MLIEATPPVPADGVWFGRTVPFCGPPDNGSCCALGSGEVEGGEPICPSASARGRSIHPTQMNRSSLFIRRSAGIKFVQTYTHLPGASSQSEALPGVRLTFRCTNNSDSTSSEAVPFLCLLKFTVCYGLVTCPWMARSDQMFRLDTNISWPTNVDRHS